MKGKELLEKIEITFDYPRYLDMPHIRSIITDLHSRIYGLGGGRNINEDVTHKQRISYRVNRSFLEIKVQKKRVLVRFFDRILPDPRGVVEDIKK